MSVLTILQGPAGSGKTAWAHAHTNPGTVIVDPTSAPMTARTLAASLLDANVNVILDASHAVRGDVLAGIRLALAHGARATVKTFQTDDKTSEWIPIRAERTSGSLFELDGQGRPIMVNITELVDTDKDGHIPDAPLDATLGVTAVSLDETVQGAVRVEWRGRADGLAWTLDAYTAWLEAGCPFDRDGNAVPVGDA